MYSAGPTMALSGKAGILIYIMSRICGICYILSLSLVLWNAACLYGGDMYFTYWLNYWYIFRFSYSLTYRCRDHE